MIKTDEDIREYQFPQLWKVDDKEWVKQRREGWKNIKQSLDLIKETRVSDIKKKDYKYFKNYYLTGRDDPKTKLVGLSNCLRKYSANMLVQFWLTADHSEKTLSFMKEVEEYQEYDKRPTGYSDERWRKKQLNRNSFFDTSCVAYRYSIECYRGDPTVKWSIDNDIGPIFGELEPRLKNLFSIREELKNSWDIKVQKEKMGGVRDCNKICVIAYH